MKTHLSCWALSLPGEEVEAAAAAALVQSVHSRRWQIVAHRQELLELWCWGSALVQFLNDGEKADVHPDTSTPRPHTTSKTGHLDGAVGVRDDGDEEAEDHVDEERYEAVEVDPAKDPNQAALLLHVLEGGEHVVSVDQREQTLRHRVQRPKLQPKGGVNYHLWIVQPTKTTSADE